MPVAYQFPGKSSANTNKTFSLLVSSLFFPFFWVFSYLSQAGWREDVHADATCAESSAGEGHQMVLSEDFYHTFPGYRFLRLIQLPDRTPFFFNTPHAFCLFSEGKWAVKGGCPLSTLSCPPLLRVCVCVSVLVSFLHGCMCSAWFVFVVRFAVCFCLPQQCPVFV